MKKFIALTAVLFCASIANAHGHYRTARISFFTAPVVYTPAPLVAQYTLPVQGGCCGGVTTQSVQSFRIEPLQGATQTVTTTQPVRTERVETVTVPVQQQYTQQQTVETRTLAVSTPVPVAYGTPVLAVRSRFHYSTPVVAGFRINPVLRLGFNAGQIVIPRRFALQIGRRFSLRF